VRIQFIASAAVWSAVHCERLESQRRVGETILKNSYDGELGWDFEISPLCLLLDDGRLSITDGI
jgi:hypothetical protein